MRGVYQTSEEIRFAARLGRRIEDIRTRFDLSVSGLAKVAGVRRDTLYRWMRGETMPNPYQLHLIDSFAAKKTAGAAQGRRKR